MKKLLMLTFIILMMTACGNDNKAQQTQNPGQVVGDDETTSNQNEELDTETKEPANTEVESESKPSFQSAIPSDWGIKLPAEFPVTTGKHLTAITSSEQDAVTINFYQTDTPLEMNDAQINKAGQFVGQLQITKHATEKSASEEIDKTVFTDGEAVDLGHGITGYQDAGAGSQFTSWNEGRWAIIARSTTEKSEDSLALAKETVEYLETHMMPIPKQHGHLHIDANTQGSLAMWQKEKFVYTLTDFGDSTLDWLVTFE